MPSKTVLVLTTFYGALLLTAVSANGGCKTIAFNEKIKGKALKNHVFQTRESGSHQFCRVLCYLDNRCLSYNYGTSVNGDKEMCELNESDHVMHGEDLTDRLDTVYFRVENDCNCPKNKICRYNFVDSSHYCECKTNSAPGTQCNVTEPSTWSPIGSPTASLTKVSTVSTTESQTMTGSPGGTTTASPGGPTKQSPTTQSTTQAQATTVSSSDCELQFGAASIHNMIKITNAFTTTLQMFTISFWLKVPSSSLTLYPFSYATSSETSAISIAIKEDGVMEVGANGGGKGIDSFLQRNNVWQHFAVTWESSNGNVKLYYNGGQKSSTESGMAQTKIIPTGGILIVGQYQGELAGGFDDTKTMRGNIAGLNFWSSEFTADQVTELYKQSCGAPSGDALSWVMILAGKIRGDLQKMCPTTCRS
ncbi:uncharacterized protein LOC116293267 [Actinia tenebrosa]|uniref:Uncharacterized protein LOC116293267 n=1 Tax=Actinia tenebrosa TaxID=6105 RepID=A0A6P8HJH6_ACTTE|nr:uncharacterized protein LOC116293267 [Actinia tenebrosa]